MKVVNGNYIENTNGVIERAKSLSAKKSFTVNKEEPPKAISDYKAKELSRLKETAEQMESIFVGQMLKTMRQNIGKTNLVHGGMAEDIFQDMLYEKYSETMAKSQSFGIAEAIVSQLKDSI